jgi:hypothetical protein
VPEPWWKAALQDVYRLEDRISTRPTPARAGVGRVATPTARPGSGRPRLRGGSPPLRRIIARITRATGASFTEHGRPADALLRKRDTLLPGLSETT